MSNNCFAVSEDKICFLKHDLRQSTSTSATMETDNEFLLEYILSLHTITVEYLLPIINPEDLVTLECVSKGCSQAVRKSGKYAAVHL